MDPSCNDPGDDNEMMQKIFRMVQEQMKAEKPPPKKTRKRTYTPEQRAVLLANLKKGREIKLKKAAERRRLKNEQNKPKQAPPPSKIEEPKSEPKPEPKPIEIDIPKSEPKSEPKLEPKTFASPVIRQRYTSNQRWF